MESHAMSTAIDVNPKHYGRLLARALPSVIDGEQEYERQFARFDALWRKQDRLTPEEDRLLSLLTLVIEDYESRHHSLGGSTPQTRLRHLMEARGVTHKDVWTLFGSRGVASEVINGKRQISKAQAKRLAEYFHVTPDLFV